MTILNKIIKAHAGDIITTGRMNLFLGAEADANAKNLTNATAIGSHAEVDASNKMRMGDANISAITGTVDFTQDSDRRLKQDIKDTGLGLTFILDLRPRTYRMKANPRKKHIGLISQEVKETMDKQGVEFGGYHPPAVQNSNTSFAGLQSGAFVMPLINAIKELTARVERLEFENESLRWGMANPSKRTFYTVHDVEVGR